MAGIQKIQTSAACRLLRRCLPALCACLWVAGCTPPNTVSVKPNEGIQVEQTQLRESSLLDVGIVVFAGGEISQRQKQQQGITPEIRQAEARYISYHLRQTMQATGAWGAVNVLPAASEVADVIVSGEIIQSSGEALQLKVSAKDSSGARWFEKNYLVKVSRQDYTKLENAQDLQEIYQAMYNRIANDLYQYRQTIDDAQSGRIRNTSELKYAARLAPSIYQNYFSENEDGRISIVRLPALDDPSLLRVRKIREREYLLVDAINEHYGNFYDNVQDPYANWRKYYLLETLQKRKIEREAKLTKALGAAAVAGSVLLAVTNKKISRISPELLIAGVAVYKDGANAAEEAIIHRAAIIELSQSLQADVQPLVVEVDGETLELTGSLDEQYRQWRVLLEKIYQQDIGLPPESDDRALTAPAGDISDSQAIRVKEVLIASAFPYATVNAPPDH